MSGASNVFVNAQNTQTVAFVGSAIYLANEAQRPKNCGDSIPTPALMNSAGQTSFAFDLTCGSRRLSGHVTYTYPSSGVTGALDGKGGFVLVNPVSLGISADFTATGPQIGTIGIGPSPFDRSGCTFPLKVGTPPVTDTASCSFSRLPVPEAGDPVLSATGYIGLLLRFNDAFEQIEYELRVYYAPDLKPCTIVAVDHIEVVQAVQDVKNSVPLITGKPTVARVFFHIVDPPQTPLAGVTGVLRGFHGDPGPDTELSGSPRKAFGSGSAKVQNSVQREAVDQSLNYELPAEWITDGDLTLRAEATIPPCETRADPIHIQGSTKVTFGSALRTGRTSWRVGWVPYCHLSDMNCPDEAQIPSYGYLMKKLYPLAPSEFQFQEVNFGRRLGKPAVWRGNDIRDDKASAFKAYLDSIYELSESSSFDQLVGVIYQPGEDAKGVTLYGTSNPDWVGGRTPQLTDPHFGHGRVTVVLQSYLNNTGLDLSDLYNPIHFNAATLAHELAHNLGRAHPQRPMASGITCQDQKSEALFNILNGRLFTDWPYSTADIQEVGFDPENLKVIPSNYTDYMSYCDLNGIQDWTSPWTYTQLATVHLLPSGGIGYAAQKPAPRALAAGVATSAQVLIRGWALRDGTAGSLNPVYNVLTSDAPRVSDPAGSHCIRFSGAAGAISDFCFSLGFVEIESRTVLDKEYFAFKAPMPEGVTRIALVTGGNEIAALSATSAPPQLSITSPAAGDQWNGGTQTIAWTASDQDGAPLAFNVLYSSDGGQSWLPMAIDITDYQYTFDPSQIAGGNNVMFRVMATDGLNSTSVDVGPVTVLQTPAIAADTQKLNFAIYAIGDSPTQTFLFSNTGSGPLTVSSFQVDNPVFRVAMPAAPLKIRAGGSATITVQWRADAAGPINGNLTISSNDPVHPTITLALAGIGPELPKISVTPSSFDFQAVPVRQSKMQQFTISNTGQADLHVQSVTLSGDPSFSLPAFTATTVAVGKSINVSVTFQPLSADLFTASLAVTSDDPNQTRLSVKLAGKGTASPSISVNPSSLDFGAVNVGQTSPAKAITVTNTGNASALVTLSTAAPFAVTPPTLNLASNGGTGTAFVTFAPTASGSASRNLTVTTNGQSSAAASVSLTGTGAAAQAPANFAGQWNSDYGPMTLLQSGSSVTGTYPSYSGTITGTVSGIVLTGNWSDTTGTGTLIFTLSADGNSFTGIWTRRTGSGNSGGTWNGTRTTTPPPPTGGTCVASPSNIVSWWTGDGNANDSTGGNNGTLQGGAAFAAGKVGQAFSFDGSSGYVNAGNPANLQLTSGITIEAWINPRSGPSSGNNLAAVLTKWGQKFDPTPDADSYGLWLRSNGSALTMFTAIHQSGTSEPNLQGGSIALNTWSHVAMTFDSVSSQFVLYVNGQAVTSSNSPGAIRATGRNVFIGREDSILPRPFNGLIDEVSISGRALSASEIQAIYNAGSAGRCKSGSGGTPTTGADTVLKVDGGEFDFEVGFPDGTATAYFVNRLTPPSYPATIKSVQLFFSTRDDGLQRGAPLTIISGTNSSGSSTVTLNSTTDRVPASITALDTFMTVNVPQRTITSGDFIVGFVVQNPPGIYPGEEDDSTPSQRRSYISNDGQNFALLDAISPDLAGNLGIRAVVTLGGGTGSSGAPSITTSPSSLDFGNVTVGQSPTMTLTIRNAGSGTLTVSSIASDNPFFSVVSPPQMPFNVPSGGQQITVRFSPASAGAQSGNLNITSNDASRPGLKVSLSGTGAGSGSGSTPGNAGLPSRPAGSVLDSSNPLATNLAGLFLMNEGRGTTDLNLVDGQTAAFAGAAAPTWNTSDPSIVFAGGSAANSFLNAGTDLTFDRLPVSKVTIVAKVYLNTLTAAGICEKNDGNSADGFLFGIDANGAIRFTVEKPDANMRVVSNAGTVPVGQWVQVGVTWDGGVGTAATAHLFLNGTEQTKATNGDGVGTLTYANATNRPFRIGTASFDGLGSLNGKMAYLAVYRGRILTPSEMSQLDARLPIR